jgi:hypothetical protein
VAAVSVSCSGDKPDKEESAGGFRCYGDCGQFERPLWEIVLQSRDRPNELNAPDNQISLQQHPAVLSAVPSLRLPSGTEA